MAMAHTGTPAEKLARLQAENAALREKIAKASQPREKEHALDKVIQSQPIGPDPSPVTSADAAIIKRPRNALLGWDLLWYVSLAFLILFVWVPDRLSQVWVELKALWRLGWWRLLLLPFPISEEILLPQHSSAVGPCTCALVL